MDPLLREQELEASKQLKQGEQDQGTPGGDGVLGGVAAALRLLVRDGEEHGLHAAQAEYVPQGDGEPPGSTGVPLTAVPLLESRSYTIHRSSAERMRAACCRETTG